MRAVIGTVISSKPITLEGAAATLSNFAAVASTRSRPELAIFSIRASRAFAELLAFHRNLRSPHTAAAGDLHSTRNQAVVGQTAAGTGIGDEIPSLGTNRAAGLENGAGSGVERDIDGKREQMKETGEVAIENVSADGKRKKRKKKKERVEAAEGNRSREVELPLPPEELKEVNAVAAPGIDKERDEKRKKKKDRKESMEGNRSREVELAVRREEPADNAVVPGIDNERGGKKKKKKRSRDAELAAGSEDPGMNAVSRLEGVDDNGDGKRAMLKERAVPEEVSMGVVLPEVKVEKEEVGEERSEERKKKRRREKNKNREDDSQVNARVLQVEVKLEKDEFGEERRSEERRNREGEVNVDGGGKKRKHLDVKIEEGGLEGRREPHNKNAELGDQSEQRHKKKRRKRE